MIDVVKLEGRTFVLFEHKNIGVKNIRLNTGENISALTAVVSIYDSSGAVVLNSTNMTIAGLGTPYVSATYLLTTGNSPQLITAAGTYRAVYTVLYGSETFVFQQTITVLADPF